MKITLWISNCIEYKYGKTQHKHMVPEKPTVT